MKSTRLLAVIAAALSAAAVGVAAPLASATPAGNLSPVVEEKWKPLPQVYSGVNDPGSGLQFPYGGILSVSQTRDLYRSGVLPAVTGLNIRAGDLSEIARVTRSTIEEQRLLTENGCILLMYSPTAMYNRDTGEMTHWAGHWYRGLDVCTP
ncbi:hypothetical protein [Gordonia sp. HS-NH1]|uniref:hypothetical protein n=1 Tax=Gordonia sp. HS-NH1 TaxID=1435068 RepID=UPI0006E38A89|nr:hypothetical protein [Gordonia sp. HS-NH1]